MPVPAQAPSAPATNGAAAYPERELARLSESRQRFLRQWTHRRSFAGSFLRGMTSAFRRPRVIEPPIIRDEGLAIALAWYEVGKHMRAVMGDFEKDPAYQREMRRRMSDEPD